MAKEWYREADNRVEAEALTRAEVEKSLGVVKQEQLELFKKLKSVDQAHSSAKTGLKMVESRLRSSAKNFIQLR